MSEFFVTYKFSNVIKNIIRNQLMLIYPVYHILRENLTRRKYKTKIHNTNGVLYTNQFQYNPWYIFFSSDKRNESNFIILFISCFSDLSPFKIIITHFSSKQVHSFPLVVSNFINSVRAIRIVYSLLYYTLYLKSISQRSGFTSLISKKNFNSAKKPHIDFNEDQNKMPTILK